MWGSCYGFCCPVPAVSRPPHASPRFRECAAQLFHPLRMLSWSCPPPPPKKNNFRRLWCLSSQGLTAHFSPNHKSSIPPLRPPPPPPNSRLAKTRTLCEHADEQWLEMSMAGTSSSADRPFDAPIRRLCTRPGPAVGEGAGPEQGQANGPGRAQGGRQGQGAGNHHSNCIISLVGGDMRQARLEPSGCPPLTSCSLLFPSLVGGKRGSCTAVSHVLAMQRFGAVGGGGGLQR